MPIESGFFQNEVLGALRSPANIVFWNIASPNPSGLRHVESGSYRKTAHGGNVGGFTAQMESGVALDFGPIAIPGSGSGFATNTTCITFNQGELNANPNSRFNNMFASGTASEDFTAFNFRLWVGNLDAFDSVAYSGSKSNPVEINPVFRYLESAEWRQGFVLDDGEGSILPSSVLTQPNIFARGDEVMVSGSYLDREFSNFIYVRGFFPDLPSDHFYKLGTYGGLGLNTFTLKFSYDYTAKNARIVPPFDTNDFATY